jgi:hypothetical protein
MMVSRKIPVVAAEAISESKITSTLEELVLSEDEDDEKKSEEQKASDDTLCSKLVSLNISTNDASGGKSDESCQGKYIL